MELLRKIKDKILESSNSYCFYRDNYSKLLNNNEKYTLKIKSLESKLSDKHDEILLLNDYVKNNNDLASKYDVIGHKLDELSNENANIIGSLDSINKSSVDLLNVRNDVPVIMDILRSLSEDNVGIVESLGSINKSSVDLLNVRNDILVIMDILRSLSEDNVGIVESLGSINKSSVDLLNVHENYATTQNKLNNFLDLSNKFYKEYRKYFFNGYENMLKLNMDVDFLFNICFFNDISFLSFSPEENRILLKSKEGIIFSTNNHFWTIMEIYGLGGYSIPQLYYFEDFVVLDVGMNRAYASLSFANFDNCSAVYGFEIDKSTYDVALDNINLNPSIKDKITPFNIGLSDCDEFVDLYYLDGFDGINTMIPEFTDVQPRLKLNKNTLKSKSVEVKKASPILNKIITNVKSNSKIVLKIDTEGAEYKIIRDLIESNLILKIDVILGEGHIFSDENFIDDLKNLGFKTVKLDKEELAYSFALVKEKYYKYWDLI